MEPSHVPRLPKQLLARLGVLHQRVAAPGTSSTITMAPESTFTLLEPMQKGNLVENCHVYAQAQDGN
ncbi:hypothetical protein RRF57_006233 [Xylaria bambusicola]|uniref:Uncharacterized protein n=1 Tax=Xylaria bambusicola TaxID=326684 RepID=A0AAN7Z8S8_9PEZI